MRVLGPRPDRIGIVEWEWWCIVALVCHNFCVPVCRPSSGLQGGVAWIEWSAGMILCAWLATEGVELYTPPVKHQWRMSLYASVHSITLTVTIVQDRSQDLTQYSIQSMKIHCSMLTNYEVHCTSKLDAFQSSAYWSTVVRWLTADLNSDVVVRHTSLNLTRPHCWSLPQSVDESTYHTPADFGDLC